MELLKLLSANELVAQIISFLILLFILKRFAWGPVLKILDERKAKIASDLKNIEDTKTEIAKLKSAYDEKIRTIEDNAAKKVQEAVLDGRNAAEDIKRNAHLTAQGIIDSAKDSLRYEISMEKEKLKERLIELTTLAAESIIKEKMTEDIDKKLIKEFVSSIDGI